MDELQKLVQQHLDNYFPYLTWYGFEGLREEETYFICPWYFYNNGIVELSIQCQGKFSLLQLYIDDYDFRLLEPKNTILIAIENQFHNLYPIAFDNGNQKKQKRKTKKENTLKQLEQLGIEWLIEMSAVLFRHSNVLNGNLEILKKNQEQKCKKDQDKRKKRE